MPINRRKEEYSKEEIGLLIQQKERRILKKGNPYVRRKHHRENSDLRLEPY
jgi:hypothetical protein